MTFLTSIILIFMFNTLSFSQDTISVKYFPLNVGNKWIYTIQTNFPPFDNYKIYEIERDTTINNHKYFLYKSNNSSEWMRYDSLTGNLLLYVSANGCSIYSNDKIIDSLSSNVGDVINCQYQGIYTRECTQISTELIFNSIQKQTKEFEHDGLVLHNIRYAQDFGIIFYATGEPPPASYFEILKGCIINGIVYGDTTLTSVQQISSIVPDKYFLFQNYPNPFNPSTVISYQIPSNVKRQTSDVKLIIYNALGKEIATLVNEKQSAGSYSVDFDGANFPSGVYFYKLEMEGFIETKRMVLLK